MLSAAILANYFSSSICTLIRDKRTNEYKLTNEGYELLLGELNWELSKVVTDEDRADDIGQLLDDAA